MVVANNKIDETKNSGKLTTILMAMAMRDAAVRRGAHRPMEHIQGFFIWSHWMPPSGECLRRIAPTAAMVIELE